MAKKMSKEELKSPDAFISTADKVGRALSEHSHIIITLLAVFLLGGLLTVGWAQYQSYTERQAEETLYPFEAQIAKAREDATTPDSTKPAAGEDSAPPEVNFEQDLEPITKRYMEAIESHDGTKAALVARMNLAALYSEFDRADAAAEVLEEGVNQADSEELITALAKSQLANVQATREEYDSALSLYSEILELKQAEYLHPDVMLKIGLVHEKRENWDQARDMYTRVSTEYADTEAGRSAKSYLRLLQLRQGATPQNVSEEAPAQES